MQEPLLEWLRRWEENLADRFFDLNDADDAKQFADAMQSRLGEIIAALTPGASVTAVHTEPEGDHDRPPGAQRP